jgi:hypothetical protein
MRVSAGSPTVTSALTVRSLSRKFPTWYSRDASRMAWLEESLGDRTPRIESELWGGSGSFRINSMAACACCEPSYAKRIFNVRWLTWVAILLLLLPDIRKFYDTGNFGLADIDWFYIQFTRLT